MTQSMLSQFPKLFQDQPAVPALTDEAVLEYLRTSGQFGALKAAAQRETLILQLCDRLEITVDDAALQASGDRFRHQHRLTTVVQMLEWLEAQQITVEDWAEGIRRQLLTELLQSHLFGESIDNHYLQNRSDYDRIALSQIIVATEADAIALLPSLQKHPERFAAIALEVSLAKDVQQTAGFMGVVYQTVLTPGVAEAIAPLSPGEISQPVIMGKGVHLFKLEKRYPTTLTPAVHHEMMALLLDQWLSTLPKTSTATI
jgi:hypothetical protein